MSCRVKGRKGREGLEGVSHFRVSLLKISISVLLMICAATALDYIAWYTGL